MGFSWKKRYRRGAASADPCAEKRARKIEEGQAARRRAKARAKWVATISFLEIRMRRSTGAPGPETETIVREACTNRMRAINRPSRWAAKLPQVTDRFVMQEAYWKSDCVSFAGSRRDAGHRYPPPTGGSQAGLLAAHCARRCTAQVKTDPCPGVSVSAHRPVSRVRPHSQAQVLFLGLA